MNKASESRLLAQYKQIKGNYNEELLFFRVGEFYELLDQDAITASETLDITLTKRCNIPMCGVPFHSCNIYIQKLIDNNFRIAICEQIENERDDSGLIKREVIRIITPGTFIESETDQKKNNYIMSIINNDNYLSIAWACAAIGNLYYKDNIKTRELNYYLSIIEPTEIIINQNSEDFKITPEYQGKISIYKRKEIKTAQELLLDYIKDVMKSFIPEIDNGTAYNSMLYMIIDEKLKKNLEIFSTYSGKYKGSLLHTIDRTKTTSGHRLLRQYFSTPLTDINLINDRLDVVEFFVANIELLDDLQFILKSAPDVEQALVRTTSKNRAPKDLLLIKRGLKIALHTSEILIHNLDRLPSKLKAIYNKLDDKNNTLELLENAIFDNIKSNINEGGYIRPEYHPKLLQIHNVQNNSRSLIYELQDKYRKRANINKLKINHNNIIGYYIEIPNKFNSKILDGIFEHKQSLSNNIRYTTKELKDLEYKISSAKSEKIEIEKEIFTKIIDKVSAEYSILKDIAKALAKLDVYLSFARITQDRNYVRPIISQSRDFVIKQGRHAILESNNNFVPNDIDLSHYLYLITSPNMSGKSTFLRQNVIIALLAHMGSFIPAEHANIGIIDRLFSRIGAYDNLYQNQSTFMTEMMEVADIVNNATDRSLVIIDELGRGTAACDGIAIAYAVIKYIHDHNKCRTIFSTHYHELVEMTKSLNKIKKNYSFAIEKRGEFDIKLLYKIQEGMGEKSYGICIAKQAGLPEEIINHASKLLYF